MLRRFKGGTHPCSKQCTGLTERVERHDEIGLATSLNHKHGAASICPDMMVSCGGAGGHGSAGRHAMLAASHQLGSFVLYMIQNH